MMRRRRSVVGEYVAFHARVDYVAAVVVVAGDVVVVVDDVRVEGGGGGGGRGRGGTWNGFVSKRLL